MDNMNKIYKDIINSFVVNILLHHIVMSWIIEKHKELKYDIDKHNGLENLATGHRNLERADVSENYS